MKTKIGHATKKPTLKQTNKENPRRASSDVKEMFSDGKIEINAKGVTNDAKGTCVGQ